MKKGFNVLLILCAALAAISCSKTKSYTDMLNDEKDAIDRLIASEGFEILKDFPADTVFSEKQFVKLKSGVYLNIIDRGTSERAVKYKTKILYRCNMHYFLDADTVLGNYGPHSNGTLPFPTNGSTSIPFTYGDYSSSYSNELSHYYVSEGIQEPLQYVGDRAKVSLIVPFKRGTYSDQGKGEPIHYEVLEYIFDENL